uniref:ABC transporter substrate-binding protein n=1 Tax=Anaerotignum lactatifermentans TaxID=160404 RepID=UPI003AB3532C
MKRTTARVTAAAVAAMMAMASLSGCGVMSSASKEVTTQSTTSTQQDSKEIHDLVLAHLASTEISTFNLLNSQTRADIQYLTNMLDGMVEVDSYGNIVPGIATDWTTEDGGKTWTFHLRDNVTWVDVNGNEKAKLTADDFMTGMEWVLNFHKNDSANVSMPSDMIQGAKEYYEYTK